MWKTSVVKLALLGLPAFSASASAQNDPRPFLINSLPSTYPLAGLFEGTYEVANDSIVVTVRAGMIESHIPRRIGTLAEIRQVEVTVGLGVPYEDGWTIDTLGTSVAIVSSLAGESATTFANLRFVIPRQPALDLSERWLIFQLGAKHQGLFGDGRPGRFVNYACQEENLLGATEDSRERARGMRTRYSTIC